MFFYYWLIAIMPLDQHWLWGHAIVGDFTVIKALGLLVFGIALVKLLFRRTPVGFLSTSPARWYVAFFFFQCFSALEHPGQLVNPGGAYSHVFSVVALFVTVLVMMESWSHLQWSLLVAIGAAGYVSLYAIRTAQVYGATTRPGGMFGDSNEYALVVGMWMPLAFQWGLDRKRPVWQRAVCVGSLVSALLGTTFAASRGGFLGFVASFLYLILHSQHKVRNLLLVCTVALPLVLFSPHSPLQRLRHPGYSDEEAEHARLTTWKAGLRMVRAHPVVGVGIGNFKAVVLGYEGPGEHVLSLCHDTYIEIGSELGLAAVVPFTGVLISSILSLRQVRCRYAKRGDLRAAVSCLGMEAGILSFLVCAVFVSAWWEKLVWLQIFLAVSAVRLAGRSQLVTAASPRGSGMGSRVAPGEAVEAASGYTV